jgi:hypothetical protein
MTLEGLPDFQQPIEAGAYRIYFPFGGGDRVTVTPDGLQVARLADGSPDFSLALIRGANPALPPEPQGRLDMRLQAHYALDEALSIARDQRESGGQQALVVPVSFVGGFLRLRILGTAGETPPDMLKPLELGWNGLGLTRVAMRLTQDSALQIKNALQGDVLAMKALAEMEISGVSPRLPLQVQFDPAVLLDALCALAGAQPGVPRQDILDYFHRDAAALPVEIEGELTEAQFGDFAQAMTDRVRMRFGRMIPSPEENGAPAVELVAPESIGHGVFRWDLSEPFQALRPVVFALNPLEAAREVVQSQGLEAVVHEITVPALQAGILPVTVLANLPSPRPGVLMLGATLRAAPRMPWRPQASIVSVQFDPPEDRSEARLHLSPIEPPEYSYSTFVVTGDSLGAQQLETPETPHSGSYLLLNIDSFPLDFIPVKASPNLLALANLHGVLHMPGGAGMQTGPARDLTFDLDREHPEVALAMQKGISGATLEISIEQKENPLSGTMTGPDETSGSMKMIHIGPLPAVPLQLDLPACKEYGPHTINMTCNFPEGAALAAFDLLAEDQLDQPEQATTLSFVPAQPSRSWTYFARSPFRAGYVYRAHSLTDPTAGPWSSVQSPFEPLVLQVSQLSEMQSEEKNG